VPLNEDAMFAALGFAIYAFEGIGIIMPCMQACDCPERFDYIYAAGIATMTTIFLFYGTIMYLAFGNMKE
jgi:solute carrier family 36 (proton-coupled amino acid transporter)